MSPKGNKTSTYIFIGLAALIGIAGGAFYLWRPSSETQEGYTILSQNVADIQTNPIEYTSVLRELSDPAAIDDASLRLAAKKLLAIDTDEESYECRHQVPPLEKSLYQALETYYQLTTEQAPATKKMQKEAEDFLFERLNKSKSARYALTLDQRKFSGFDKAVRQLGTTRFSPLFYDTELMLWLQKNPKDFDIEAFTEHWLRSMKPHIKALYQQASDDGEDLEALRQSYLFTFLFDLHSVKRLFEHGGVEAWVTLAKKLQNSALGDIKQRNERLIALYKKTEPDIICLQECDASLIQALRKQGYYTPVQQTKGASETAEEGSVILYKKNRFKAENITILRLNQQDIHTYQDPTMKHRSLKKLTSHEAAIHQVDHEDMVWLVASFHASSNGDNTMTFLQALFALQKRIEEKEGKKVLLLLGIDANTSDQSAIIEAKLKKDLQNVDKLLAKHKGAYKRIQHQGEDTGTVRKARSSFQVQLLKTHVLTSGISDFILVSDRVSSSGEKKELTLVQKSTYLSPYGPTPMANPSDHRAVALEFTLEEVEKDS